MPYVRLVILVVYIVAAIFWQRRLLHHPPKPSKTFVHYLARCLNIVLALGVPVIIPLIAFLWMDFFPLPLAFVVLLALVLPLGLLYMPWLLRMQVQWARFATIVAFIVIGVTLVGIVLWVFLENDGKGITWALLPLLYFILVPPGFMLAMLYQWAPTVLPLRPEQRMASHPEASRLLTGFLSTFPRPVVFVKHGELQTRIQGNPFTGTGPGLLVTEPHNAVVLYEGTRAREVVGPGVIFTGRSEVPAAVMDLQGQFRRTAGVPAQTRDNISVHVPCSSIFRLEGSTEPAKPGEPWQFSREAALSAYLAAEVNPERQPSKLEAHRAQGWADMPLAEASYMIPHVVKRYTLDQLYAVIEPLPEELPRLSIAKEVREHVRTRMAAIGITVTGGGVGNRIMPADPAVILQRLESWKAPKMQAIALAEGESKAAEIKEESRVQREALVEVTERLQKEFAGLRSFTPTEAKRLIALRLLHVLDEIAQEPEVRAQLSGTTTQTLSALQHRASQS